MKKAWINPKYIVGYLIIIFAGSLIMINETAYHQSTLGLLLNAVGLFLLITFLHVVFVTSNAIAMIACKTCKKEVLGEIPSWLGLPLFILSWVLVIKALDYLRPVYKIFQDYTLTFL